VKFVVGTVDWNV